MNTDNLYKAKVLQILIPSGNPNGLKIVGITGWSGKCFIVPRQNLRELKNHPDIEKPGLYILFGQDELNTKKLAYIGESESFLNRITSHDSHKDFWDVSVIFTGDLNRAYVKYLEHLATKLAHDARRMDIQNKVLPQLNTLSDYDRITADQFFENLQFILSAFNYEIFDSIEESIQGDSTYYLKGTDFNAEAKLIENGNMLVLAGSIARIKETNSFGGWSKAARIRFIEDGTLRPINDTSYEFTKDTLFKSPSAGAATIAARSINGWTAWKDAAGNELDANVRK
jgi:hypothetical protein